MKNFKRYEDNKTHEAPVKIIDVLQDNLEEENDESDISKVSNNHQLVASKIPLSLADIKQKGAFTAHQLKTI